MNVEDFIVSIVEDFKRDPRNKVFINFNALLASAADETGRKLDAELLKSVIVKYMEGSLSEEEESIFDGALAVCGTVARNCFGENPDGDVDYNVEWVENDDDTFSAVVRPA